MKWYYERNTSFLSSHLNKTFEQVLWMTPVEFREWVVDLRKEITRLWDETNQPPRVGCTKDEMIEQIQRLKEFNSFSLLDTDQHTSERNVLISSFNSLGNAVNQFFPTMMKTRINYTTDVNAGRSIYDYFSKPELLESFHNYAHRHFKRDSFYSYSTPVRVNESPENSGLPEVTTGVDWIKKFESTHRPSEWDYWLSPKSSDNSYYSGFNEQIRSKVDLVLTKNDIDLLSNLIPNFCMSNVDFSKSDIHMIRVFKKGQKLFPVGFKAFRVSFCQYAVNFPPPIAKYIYEKYTKPWINEEKIYVWDPSSGWGGRLLAAMAIDSNHRLVYLGNDPNTDHTTTLGRTKYHEIVDFCRNAIPPNPFEKQLNGYEGTEFHFWQKGSENMQFDPEFQKYRGKLSLVFTSPPYFAKEAYSEDPEQSYKRFSQYDLWKESFLKETLTTAVLWLREGGYLAWNVSDVVFSNKTYPLEQDSIDILQNLGMEYVTTLKMTLSQSQGSNRIDETGVPKFKNACKINGLWRKYEPIFIFKKPLS